MRLIDADELVRKEIAFVGGPRSGGKTLAMIHSAIRHIVDNAPTVIAEPARHGKWEMVRNGICNVDFRCSACRKFKFHNGEMRKVYKYCPNCGAIMEIEQEPAEQMQLF